MNDASPNRTVIDSETGEILDSKNLTPYEQNGGSLSTVAAEIGTQVATARRFPRKRDIELSNQIIDRSSFDEETAAECMYSIPRGGKPIEGPSARFAEIVQQVWGNNRVSGSISHIDREQFRVYSEGIYLDLETNSATRVVISRRISSTDKKTGEERIYSEDMIQVTGTAGLSIAIRNAILKGVPKVVWRSGYNNVRKIVMGDSRTLTQRRAIALTEFQRYGLTAAQVFSVLHVKDENDITLDHLVTLRGCLSALKNEETTVEELLRGASVKADNVPSARAAPAQDNKAKAVEERPEGWQRSDSDNLSQRVLKALGVFTTHAQCDAYAEELFASLDGVPRGVLAMIQDDIDARKAEIKHEADTKAKAAQQHAAAKEAAAKAAATTSTAQQDFVIGATVYDMADATKLPMKVTAVTKTDDGGTDITCSWPHGKKQITATFGAKELFIVDTPHPNSTKATADVAATQADDTPIESMDVLTKLLRAAKTKAELVAVYDKKVKPIEGKLDAPDLQELQFIKEKRLKLLTE